MPARIIAAVAAFTALGAALGAALAQPLSGPQIRAGLIPDRIRIEAAPLPLDAHDPDLRTLGAFRHAGTVRLTSPDTSRLGGLSDLRVAPDGRLYAVSDAGDLLQGRLVADADAIRGIEDAVLRPLVDRDGRAFPNKAAGDAEGLALWPNGDLMVSFEGAHRIWTYPADGGPPRPAPMPDAPLRGNGGMEALALAPARGPDAYWVGAEDGRLWLCRLSAACRAMSRPIRPALFHGLTAMAELPAGEVAFLHRGYDPIVGHRASLFIARLSDTGEAEVLDALVLPPRLELDNMEGLEVVVRPDGGLRFLMLSDDNFSPGQRTLLIAFDRRRAPAETVP